MRLQSAVELAAFAVAVALALVALATCTACREGLPQEPPFTVTVADGWG